MTTVGRKKTKPDGPARKPVVLVVRGAPEWAEWVAQLAEHCRTTASELVDDALATHAKQLGFMVKPPKR